jgi:hypothetical protein
VVLACGWQGMVILAAYISSMLYFAMKGGDSMKRNKSILVRLTAQEQAELIQAVESWNQSRESWQDEMSISKYIREAIEEKIDREKHKRKRNA